EQVSLGRRVALKALAPAAALDAVSLERFRREAMAAARLHHTNIVPVFGVGEHDGLHYFVMQLIDGQGLDAVLADLRRPPAPDLTTPAAEPGAAAGCQSAAAGPTDPALAPAEAVAAVPPGKGGASSDARHGTHWRRVARIGEQVAEALD